MIDRLFTAFLFVMLFIVGGLLIHQHLELLKYEQKQEIILSELKELQKRARLNAQDIDFLEKLVIEGGVTNGD